MASPQPPGPHRPWPADTDDQLGPDPASDPFEPRIAPRANGPVPARLGLAGLRSSHPDSGTRIAYTPDPSLRNPTRRPVLRRWLQLGVVLGLFSVAGLVLVWVLGGHFEARALAVATTAAVLPLLVIIPTYLWIDRYEAEPVRYLVFAFGWGALVAAMGALALNTATIGFLYRAGAGVGDVDLTGPVMVAPVVEETMKGLGVAVIYLFRRHQFDGIVDGIVYAGLVGAGFAFSENILYLARAYETYGEPGLHSLFFLRCIMSPFAHPMFTACIGIGLGVAVTRRSPAVRMASITLGWLCAMLLHGLWNGTAALPGDGFFTAYVVLQMPLFAAFIGLIVVARRREVRLAGRYLSAYADAGWLTHGEVAMLSRISARRSARAWAKETGGRPAVRSMQSFQDAASELAVLRARMVRGLADDKARRTELELLESMMRRREEFLGAPARVR